MIQEANNQNADYRKGKLPHGTGTNHARVSGSSLDSFHQDPEAAWYMKRNNDPLGNILKWKTLWFAIGPHIHLLSPGEMFDSWSSLRSTTVCKCSPLTFLANALSLTGIFMKPPISLTASKCYKLIQFLWPHRWWRHLIRTFAEGFIKWGWVASNGRFFLLRIVSSLLFILITKSSSLLISPSLQLKLPLFSGILCWLLMGNFRHCEYFKNNTGGSIQMGLRRFSNVVQL